MSPTGDILVVNAGSSSIKFSVFSWALETKCTGSVTGIGGDGAVEVEGTRRSADLPDHGAALEAVLSALDAREIKLGDLRAAAHRVVHGGRKLSAPARVTNEVTAEIAACTALAPLHNPHNLAAIERLRTLAPDLDQCASFDTAFHATNPEVATRYAVPAEVEAMGIRRYGFHGLSYAALVATFADVTGQPLPRRLLAFHLGNGASMTAIKDGASTATTMGYSPLEGLTMGTRSGGIDANAVLRMVHDFGAKRTGEILNHESGLLGLSGLSADMRTLTSDRSPSAAFAVEHFCYWACRHAGSLIASMEGVDAIAFTGGIGENAALIRQTILKGLAWAGVSVDPNASLPALHAPDSPVSAWVIPAREEWMIARDAKTVLSA